MERGLQDVNSQGRTSSNHVRSVGLVRNLVFGFGLLHFDTVGMVWNRNRTVRI